MSSLPISVVLPTLNCRHKLCAHIDSCRAWLGCVAEVVVVDSNSTDGSLEFLRDALQIYNAKFLSTAPGLYAAWNRGVQEGGQPYVYFSTIGESISDEGLHKLLGWCEAHNLDVAISTPHIVNPDGSPTATSWPIHEMAEFLNRQGEIYLPDQLVAGLLGGVFLPRSIMGSSASNLYRRSALVEYPFPENVGAQGDVLWGAKFLGKLRVGLSGEQFSTFLYDGVRGLSFSDYAKVVRLLQREVLQAEETTTRDLHHLISRSIVRERLRFGNRLSHLRNTLDRRKQLARFLRKFRVGK